MADEYMDVDEGFGADVEAPKGKGPAQRQGRKASQSPLAALFASDSRQLLVEWACDVYARGDDDFYNKSEISEMTGLSRQSVFEHVDTLVDFGVLEQTGENRKRYRPNDETAICAMLMDVNGILYDYYTTGELPTEDDE